MINILYLCNMTCQHCAQEAMDFYPYFLYEGLE